MVQQRLVGVRCLLAVLLAAAAGAASARAGGGPENVFLVVNSASWASLAVANHFIYLRHIPPVNVFYIDWTAGVNSIDGDTLRDKILVPTLDTIDRRGLLGQIDYVVYSSDFPSAIDLAKDFPTVKFPDQARPACSLNSATYLWNLVLSKLPIVMEYHINHYVRNFGPTPISGVRHTDQPTHGFHGWYGWGNRGELIESGGQPYMLSTVLAVTSGRGNSVREAIGYLERSAAADGTHPKGTIYFARTDDVRSKARANGLLPAIEELQKLGVSAEEISSPLPNNRADVAGAMTGVANYSWGSTRSTILPGAICENFTSFGGQMAEGSGQTPFTEFLRYGAAGSSGTIEEPYAMPEKFPWPEIQVHYARGCSLAEAYYQSVFAPAQLLIVGDPLCRPWANIPKVQVAGVRANDKVSGRLVLRPEAQLPGGGSIDHYELFVDGRRLATAQSGRSLAWNSTVESDGYHELRVVAFEAGPIETQGHLMIPVVVDNQGRSAELTTSPAKSVRWDEALTVHAKAPGARQIYVLCNSRALGVIAGEEGQLSVNPRLLGLGPVSLQAVAVAGASARDRVVPPPVSLVIEAPKPLGPLKDPPKRLAPGLLLKLPDGKVTPVQETRDPAWLALAGIGPNQPFVGQAFFEVSLTDVYQFQLWHHGELKLSVDGVPLYSSEQGSFTQQVVPTALAAGVHRLSVTGRSGADVKLRILFGGPGALSLDGKSFRHQAR